MRITRDTLLKVARETTSLRVQQDRSIVTVYLIGSLLTEQPLLGGTTDIDLVMIHSEPPEMEREIVRMSDEVHLDIAHYSQADFEQPRLLRVNPWLGPSINHHPLLLHDTQHWFEFTQASAGSQFDRPDYILGRARPFAQSARETWLRLHAAYATGPGGMTLCETVRLYLQALADATNAIASLAGAPLVERRFLLGFPERSRQVGQAGLDVALLALIGDQLEGPEPIQAWLPDWAAAFGAAGALEGSPAKLCAPRLLYYQQAILALAGSDQPWTALWPLLTTWTSAACCFAEEAPQRQAWQGAIEQLNLGAENIPERLMGLDAYLDRVEEALDNWAHENGVFES